MSLWTKTKGIGGKLQDPEDFVVHEILSVKFLRKYRISRKIEKPGKYNLILVRKRNVTTKSAIERLAAALRIPEKNIGYAGLKDKFSVSHQYLTVKGTIKDVDINDVAIVEARKTDKFLSRGDLIGNKFKITLHGCTGDPSATIADLEKRGIPNFFGPQRFGKYGNNHEIGLSIIKRNYSKRVPKDVLKFYIHAYQSWIFNNALSAYAKKNKKPYFRKVRIPGYKMKLRNNEIENEMKRLLEKDRVRTEDFRISELRMSVIGAERAAFIKTKIKYEKIGDKVVLNFELPKGSYATVLIREISKS